MPGNHLKTQQTPKEEAQVPLAVPPADSHSLELGDCRNGDAGGSDDGDCGGGREDEDEDEDGDELGGRGGYVFNCLIGIKPVACAIVATGSSTNTVGELHLLEEIKL